MKVKTYDPDRAKGKKKNVPEPDGHDDGSGGEPREEQGQGVPYWIIDDGVPELEEEQK